MELRLERHRRLSESRNKRSEEGYWKDFHNSLVISLKRAETLFVVSPLDKKTAKNCENQKRSFKNYCYDF
jgi:hypothetical protein